MIQVTDLKGNKRFVNAELVEFIEANPDTQIVLVNGHRFYAIESPLVLAQRIVAYRKECHGPPSRSQSACGDQPISA